MSKTVLIVDDSASVRQIVSLTLKDSGFNVIEAIDGIDALKKLSGEKIHIIISDVNMPLMDGISLVKSIKDDPKYADYKFTPIIMLTTESEDDMKQKGKVAGVSAWMVKPFSADDLSITVQKLSLA